MKKAYKIVEKVDGKVKTLFHGLNGSRTLPIGEWLTADMKEVKDGTSKNSYTSGWHVLPTVEDCKNYLTKFKNRLDCLIIVECEVDGRIWEKEHSPSPVFLAEHMRINSEVS